MSLVRSCSFRSPAAVLVVIFLCLGCRTSDKGVRPSVRDAAVTDAPVQDGAGMETTTGCNMNLVEKKQLGSACGCAQECTSGFCVDGLCCDGACTGECQSCNGAGTARGTCGPVTDGTPCGPGMCQGSSVVGAKACSQGQCAAGPTTVCSPYTCDTTSGRCFSRCTTDNDCDGRPCVGGSCGKKPLGAECAGPDDCDSGSCADGVCCNVACTGPCVSCNQVGDMGECSPVSAGSPDPHGKCVAEPRTSCGVSGLCNGQGGCAKHAAGTECLPASCSSGSEIPMSICDGNGTCLVGAPVPCAPFVCSGTACKLSCTTGADCTAGNPCSNGSCGKIPMGAACTRATDCASGFCVDGFCCNSACGGTCENCGLPNARGRCTAVGAGAVDPRGVCKDMGSTSCGNNGRCNGSKACQKYPDATPCRSSSCDPATNRYTQDATCKSGACSAPPATTCAPYKCNGTQCGRTCATNNDCQSPSTCVNGSCGLKPLGAVCSRADECASKLCAQGVCCNSACTGSCFSCNQTGMAGQCTAVAAGNPDPAGVCTNQGQASCGNDGTCNGLGGCRKYAPGSTCAPATCANGVARTASTCDGSGRCNTGSMRTCAPYVCNATGTGCTDSCSNSSQCLPPNTCDPQGLCGKKGLGSPCNSGNECAAPGHCVEGFCCNTACTESCKSCAVTGAQGTCTNVAAGQPDPKSMCTPAAQATCGNDGTCSGTGTCRKHQSGACRAAVCSGSMLTPGASCSGGGTCPTAAPVDCAPFTCNDTGTGCRTSCTPGGTGECTAGNACIAGVCVGKKANGNTCTANDQCTSDKCVAGICCNDACTGSCKSCNLSGSVGTCTNVGAGQDDPTGMCMSQAGCGQNGKCNGSGGCQLRGSETTCAATCSGNSVQPQACNGAGACADSGSPTSCGAHVCRAGACASPCADDNDCVTGKVCASGSCQDPAPPVEPPATDAGM